MISKVIMSKTGKKIRKVQAYRCDNNHFFLKKQYPSWTNSFVELVVFIYLNSLSLNITINIVRAIYDTVILSKSVILDFLEQVADEVPDINSTDQLFNPGRSGFLALDGVWFKFRGMDIVLLVCFDPETFDIINATWSLTEDEASYSKLLIGVGKKLGFNRIKGIYGDGDKGLISSVKKHFPLVPFQVCIVHKEIRMGQLVPVKSVTRSKQMSEETKREIKEFQQLFRSVIYAKTKKESFANLKKLKQYADSSRQERFKKAYRSLRKNFDYTLTHFDHPGIQRDNNLIECFNGIIKPRLKLMKGFKKYQNLDRYLKLFLLNYRFHPLRESRFKERRSLSPLQVAGVDLPNFTNYLSLLRQSLKLNFIPK